jgi:ADP-heptose:LPS heptosyltransferase
MQKILIIRFSSIGDIVLTSPIVRCVKEQLNAEVHYVTKTSFSSILRKNPHVDKVYSIEKEITEIISELKAEKYDFVVDLHNNLRSTRLKRALKISSSAFPKLNRQKLLYTKLKLDVMPDIHIVDRYFKTVEKLGVKNDGKGLDFFIDEEDHITPSDFGINEKFIAFSIGAQFATKRLPNHKICEIISAIKGQVVLLGGDTDSTNADYISTTCSNAVNLVGKLSLNQSASLVQQAVTIIAHDTGLMHIAAAFQKNIVSIWGNTTPKLGMYPYLPGHPEKFCVHQVELKCRPCSKIGYQKCPKKHFNCMEKQDVAEIVASINLLANTL